MSVNNVNSNPIRWDIAKTPSSSSAVPSLPEISLPGIEESQFVPPPYNVILPLEQLIQGKNGSEMAKQILRHSLRDAAKRIFYQPLRSFLEIVVNALDASVDPQKSVGKHGLGFISIFTFLTHPETQGCSIHIETTYEESKGVFSSYSMDFFEENESYKVLFKEREPQSETGTKIDIIPQSGAFSHETLEQLNRYCHYLQFYEHGKVEVKYEEVTRLIGEGSQILAWVALRKEGLSVCDKASYYP